MTGAHAPAPALPRDVVLAVNPGASRVSPALAAAVEWGLRAADRSVETHVTNGPREIRDLAARVVAGREAVFAVLGGDGSATAAAAELAGSPTPLLIVPAGTGNLLAASLGVPKAPLAATGLLKTGGVRTIDLGFAECDGTPGRHFVVAAGAGFDATVMAETRAEHKGRLGVGAYLVVAARTVRSIGNARFTITADGRRIECDAAAVLVANCLHDVLGFLRPRVRVSAADGRFDVFVAGANGPLNGLGSVARLLAAPVTDLDSLANRAHLPGALRFRAAEVRLEAEPAQPVELDGDPFASPTPVTLRTLPRALRVVVPRPNR